MFKFLIIFLSFFAMLSCSKYFVRPYPEITFSIIEYYKKGDFKNSYIQSGLLLNETKSNRKQDFYLALLENAKIALALNRYDIAIRYFQQAEKHFLDIENKLILDQELGSLFINDIGKDYKLDVYEMLFLNPYLAFAYLAKGDFNGARVERNRSINKINYYVESSNKKYLENPFARYLSALIYEKDFKFQDARIEYEKLAKISDDYKGFLAEIDYLGSAVSDLVIFVDEGLVPVKYEKNYGPILLPINDVFVSAQFRYAGIRKSATDYYPVMLSFDGSEFTSFDLLYNLEKAVLDNFNRNNSRRVKSLLKRVTARIALTTGLQIVGRVVDDNLLAGILSFSGIVAGIAGGFMDRADLRQWTTLPRNIYYRRLRGIEPGFHSLRIRYGDKLIFRNVEVKKNEIKILHFVCI